MLSLNQARHKHSTAGQPIYGPINGLNRAEVFLRRGELSMIAAGPGGGKALDLDTPVPTPTGWTTMGELSTGDMVFSPDGKPTRIYAHEPYVAKTWRLAFNDGTEVVADGDHLWNTTNRSERRKGVGPTTKTTKEIVETLRTADGRTQHRISNTAPVEMPDADLPLPPYTLGVWLGDGSTNRSLLSLGARDAEQVIHGMRMEGEVASTSRVDRGVAYACVKKTDTKPPMVAVLREMGLLGDKHIPADYLRGSVDQRVALLRGLMDTDGSACPVKHMVEFASKRLVLAEGVRELAASLGEKPRISSRQVSLNGKDHGTHYRVTWAPTRFNPFTVDFKASKVRLSTSQRTMSRFIVAAEEAGERPVRCLTVENPTSEYLVTESWVPTHNTALTHAWLHHGAGKGRKNSVLFFSADSGPGVIWKRSAALSTGYTQSDIDQMQARGDTASLEAAIQAQESHIQWVFSGTPSPELILTEMDAFAERTGAWPEVVVMDNLKDLAVDGYEDEWRGLEEAAMFLKGLARDANAAVIALHHVGGAFEDGTMPIPMSGLRGKVAKTPATILTIHRVGDVMNISPVKQRGGRADTTGRWHFPVKADLSRMKFEG